MKKIRIAQIGTSANSHGNQIWSSLLGQSDIFDVVGYALPENERQKFPSRMKAFEGYREMTVEEILNDPTIEAVAVETEEIYLTKYALMVAQAGTHLHMEKPGGTDLSLFEKLIATLKQQELVFSVGYMYRFNPKIKEAINKVKNGSLGEIFSVEAQMSCTHSPEVRRWLGGFPGGMLFFLGCHLIDLIYQIQGEPEKVIPLSCSTHLDGIDSQDYGMAAFQYKNGVSFTKACDDEMGGYMRRQLVICGSKGSIEIRPLEVAAEGGQYTVMHESSTANWFTPWQESQSEVHDRYDGMMKHFAELINGKENPYDYDYELGLYKLILKACGMEVPK